MKLLIFFFIFIYSNALVAKDEKLQAFYKDYWPLTDKSIEYLYDGKILADAEVNSDKKTQTFKLNVAALYPKACFKILRKLKMFENYKEWISFITESTYSEPNELLTVKAEHTLLPYPMIVHIIVKRPTKPGEYPFIFPTGMFTGLTGKFIIKQHNKSCAFYAQSYWKGKDTKLPDFAIELFSETLTKLGGEILFRKLR